MTQFKTQTEVEAEIDRLVRLAVRAEERRDRCEHESAAYWLHHDTAVRYHEQARRLMPRGS